VPDDPGPDDPGPDDPGPDDPGPEGALGEASSSDGFAADSEGSVAVQAAGAVRAGGSKLNARESSKGDGSLAWLSGVSRSGSGPFDRVLRDDPMLSAGSAGTPSARVASAAEARAESFGVPTGLPLAEASWPPFAEASLVSPIPFPPAGAPLTETPPPAVPSDAASSAGAVLAEADLAAVGVLADCLGGAMTSLDRVSWSSPIRSSSADLEVTTAGEAPPDPSDLSVRLSKPSSSDPDPHEVISGQDAHMTTYEKKAAFCQTPPYSWDAFAPETVAVKLISQASLSTLHNRPDGYTSPSASLSGSGRPASSTEPVGSARFSARS
jgi:hypothetical protein